MSNPVLLNCIDVSKHYFDGANRVEALSEVSFSLRAGEACAVIGPSGSGKTTLLGLCAGLDHPTSGQIVLDGQALERESEDQLAKLRVKKVGFIFQSFNLIPTLTALENVSLPLEIESGKVNEEQTNRAKEILNRLGLAKRLSHYPHQLSGGEKQRAAVARAFVTKPRLILADEPTGSLDLDNAKLAMEALLSLNEEMNAAILLVTHDEKIASQLDRGIYLHGGRIQSVS